MEGKAIYTRHDKVRLGTQAKHGKQGMLSNALQAMHGKAKKNSAWQGRAG
jgi:hypothetical protein